MKTLIIALIGLLICGNAFAQTPEEMKAWEANMTPGPQHKWLASLDGEWDASIKMWMDPSQPPSESSGTTTNQMIMNGLYQRSTHTGDMMGSPFQGENTTGFDNATKKFVSSWIDNMGSGIMIMEGTYDDASKVLTLTGNMSDPMLGKAVEVKEVITYSSPDSHTFEMYMVQDGNEMKTMEIVYTRAKE